MELTILHLKETVVDNSELFLPERHIFQKFYPLLPEKLQRNVDVFLGLLSNTMIDCDIPCGISGSLALRIVEENNGKENNDIERAHQNFRNLAFLIADPVLSHLKRGPYDIDLKVPVKEEKQFGKFLLDTSSQILESMGQKSSQTSVNGRQIVNFFLSEETVVELSFGQIGTNVYRNNGKIRWLHNGQEVFVIDVGFYPQTSQTDLAEKRVSSQTGTKAHVALPLYKAGDGVDISDADIEKQKKFLEQADADPAGTDPEVLGDIESEVEAALRDIRIGILHHRETDNIYHGLFIQEKWRRLENVFNQAGKIFKDTPPAEDIQRLWQEEIFTCIVADLPLFLLIAERTNLLQMYPYFAGLNTRNLLTNNALVFETIDDPLRAQQKIPLPLFLRNQRAILKQRELWKSEEPRYPPCKLLYHILFKQKRLVQPTEITEQEWLELRRIFSFAPSSRQQNDYFSSDEPIIKYILEAMTNNINRRYRSAADMFEVIRDAYNNNIHYYKQPDGLWERSYLSRLKRTGVLVEIDKDTYGFTPLPMLRFLHDPENEFDDKALFPIVHNMLKQTIERFLQAPKNDLDKQERKNQKNLKSWLRGRTDEDWIDSFITPGRLSRLGYPNFKTLLYTPPTWNSLSLK